MQILAVQNLDEQHILRHLPSLIQHLRRIRGSAGQRSTLPKTAKRPLLSWTATINLPCCAQLVHPAFTVPPSSRPASPPSNRRLCDCLIAFVRFSRSRPFARARSASKLCPWHSWVASAADRDSDATPISRSIVRESQTGFASKQAAQTPRIITRYESRLSEIATGAILSDLDKRLAPHI